MKLAKDLTIGDVLRTKLEGDKGTPARTVVKVRPRTGLTRVETVFKDDANKREIHELRSDLELHVN